MNTAEVSNNQSVVTRTVTVVSTRGEKKKFDFSGTTWAELKPVLQAEGYSLTNMKL
jgi:hypothetical protein